LPGEKICKELEKDKAYSQIPIIIVMGKNTDAHRVIGRVIGVDYSITKPFDLDALDEKTRILLG